MGRAWQVLSEPLWASWLCSWALCWGTPSETNATTDSFLQQLHPLHSILSMFLSTCSSKKPSSPLLFFALRLPASRSFLSSQDAANAGPSTTHHSDNKQSSDRAELISFTIVTVTFTVTSIVNPSAGIWFWHCAAVMLGAVSLSHFSSPIKLSSMMHPDSAALAIICHQTCTPVLLSRYLRHGPMF